MCFRAIQPPIRANMINPPQNWMDTSPPGTIVSAGETTPMRFNRPISRMPRTWKNQTLKRISTLTKKAKHKT